MENGISKYPKHFLLTLISKLHCKLMGIAGLLANNTCSNRELVDKLKELILDEEVAFLYLATNSIIEGVKRDKKEIKAILAEVDFHKEAFEKEYNEMKEYVADIELTDILTNVGIDRD